MQFPSECYCGICGRVQYEPRLLDCRHSFCAACITATANVATCATCGSRTQLNSSWGVLGLTANASLEQYITRHSVAVANAQQIEQQQQEETERRQKEEAALQQHLQQQAEAAVPQQNVQPGMGDSGPYSQLAMMYGPYSAVAASQLSNAPDSNVGGQQQPLADAIIPPEYSLPPQALYQPEDGPTPQQEIPEVVEMVHEEPPPVYLAPPHEAGPQQSHLQGVPAAPAGQLYPTVNTVPQSQAVSVAPGLAVAASCNEMAPQAANQSKPEAKKEEEKTGFLASIGNSISQKLNEVKGFFFTEEDVTSTATGRVQQNPVYSHFVVTIDQANVKVNKWLSGLWFAPNGFAEKCKPSPVRVLWVPFYIFNAASYTSYSAVVEKSWAAEHKVDGIHEAGYKNIILCATTREDDTFWKETMTEFGSDWKYHDAKNLTSDLSVVMPAHDPWDAVWRSHCKTIVNLKEQEGCQNLLKKAGLFPCKDFSFRVGFADVRSKLVYMPMYTSSYTFEGETFRVAVHGHSGKVHGGRPYGAGKLGGLGNKLSGLFGKKK